MFYCAAVGFADVTSGNTVGYLQKELNTEIGEYIHVVGFNFNKVGGGKEDVVVVDSAGEFCGYQCVDGDQIYVFNSEFFNYDVYTFTEGIGWLCTPGDLVSEDYLVDGFSFNANEDCFVYPYDPSTCKLSISGEVAPSGKQTIPFNIDDDYIFPFANPFPVDTKFSDLTFAEEGDQVYVFNPEFFNYDVYTFTEGIGWLCTPGDLVSEDYLVDDDFVVLKAGEGGMLYPTDSRVWEITFDYNK